MCGSMADIQSPTAEIRRGKNKRQNKRQDENIYGRPVTWGDHKIVMMRTTPYELGSSGEGGAVLVRCQLTLQLGPCGQMSQLLLSQFDAMISAVKHQQQRQSVSPSALFSLVCSRSATHQSLC